MILNCSFTSVNGINIAPLRRMRRAIVSLAEVKPFTTTATNMTEQLRTQIDQLHLEVEITRSKVASSQFWLWLHCKSLEFTGFSKVMFVDPANSARVRLMRLAEAAENLQQQAAVSIQAGKENEAKGLLLQKRQVMLALEKSKRRIEVLDKLSSKLSEAVSLKESQLIGNVASYSSVSTQDTNHPIRIISPKEDYEDSKDEDFEIPDSKLYKAEEPEKHQAERPLDYQLPANEWAGNINFSVDDQKLNSLKGISSYSDFLDHIKEQLKQIETDLLTMLRISTLVLESEEKQKNTKVQLTLELLEDVSSIRRRIASIMQTETDDS